MASQVDPRRQKKRSTTSAKKLNKYLEELARAEEASSKRNQELLADITKVTKNAQLMNLQTENLRNIRDEYEDYFGKIYPNWLQDSERNSTLEKGSVRNQTLNSKDIYHSTPLHSKNENVPPLSVPGIPKRHFDSLSPNLEDINENVPPAFERNRRPSHSLSVDLEDEELQTQYRDFIKKKMGSWRKFPSLPDDLDSSFYRTNDQLIDLLQDRINKCELHLRDLGNPSSNQKELDKNLDVGFRTSKRALQEIEIECERLKSEYITKYATHMNKTNERVPPDLTLSNEESPRGPISLAGRSNVSPSHRQFDSDLSPLNQDYLGYKISPVHQRSTPVPKSTPRACMQDLLSRDFLIPLQRISPTENSINASNCFCNSMNKSNYSNDDSCIRILPQLLGLSPEGQLVLLPMAEPLKGTLCSREVSATSERLYTETRSSPVGQSSGVGDIQSRVDGTSNLQNANVESYVKLDTNAQAHDVVSPEVHPALKDFVTDNNVKKLPSKELNFDVVKDGYENNLSCKLTQNESVDTKQISHMDTNSYISDDSNHSSIDKRDDVLHSKKRKSSFNTSSVRLSNLDSKLDKTDVNMMQKVSSSSADAKSKTNGKDFLEISSDLMPGEESIDPDNTKGARIFSSFDSAIQGNEHDGRQITMLPKYSNSSISVDETDLQNSFPDVIHQSPCNKTMSNMQIGSTGESPTNHFSAENSQHMLFLSNEIDELKKLDMSIELENSLEIEKSVSYEKSVELDKLIEACKSDELNETNELNQSNELDRSNNSVLSGFTDDASEFNLPSTGDVKSTVIDDVLQKSHAKEDMELSYQGNENDNIIRDQSDGKLQEANPFSRQADDSILSFLIDKLVERVQDDQSEEVLVLNLEIDAEVLNAIAREIKGGGDLGQFNTSQICMVYRHQLQNTMEQKEKAFILDSLDSSNDFEGHLRDCIEPCYLNIWDSLFAFLSMVMAEFDFDPSQVASIYASVLVPDDEKMMNKLQMSLANILYAMTIDREDEEETEFSLKDEGIAGNQQKSAQFAKSVSITEEFSTKGLSIENQMDRSQMSSSEVNNKSDMGDLSKTISLEHSHDKQPVISEKSNKKEDNQNDDEDEDSSLGLGSVSLDLSDNAGHSVNGKEHLLEDASIGNEKTDAEDMSQLKKVNLEASKSFDFGSMSSHTNDSDSDSDAMSFNSDGLPVPKSRKKPSSSRPSEEDNITKGGANKAEGLDITSPSYQKMRQESLVSPIDESDDDDLDNMLGESLGLSSKGSSLFRMKVSSSGQQQELSSKEVKAISKKTGKENASDLDSRPSNVISPALKDSQSSSINAKLKKPGFWENSDEDSDEDVVINQINKAATAKNDADDDDFDFDFYD